MNPSFINTSGNLYSLLLYAYMPVRFTSCNQFADGIAERGEFFFIFCHDIPLIHQTVTVQVIGAGRKLPKVGGFYLLNRKVKKSPVICLEFHLAAGCEHAVIAGEIFF